jgi:O-antigen/teichoic acid export membrane protein
MGIVERQTARNTIITYAGTGLGFVNAVLLFPRFLGPDELGLVNLFPFMAVLYAQFSSMGLLGTILRFFPFFRDRRRQHHGFLFMASAATFVGFILVTLVFVLIKPLVVGAYADTSTLLVEYYFAIVPLGLLSLWHLLLENYSSALFRTVVPSLARAIVLRVGNTLAIFLFASGVLGFRAFVVVYIANTLIPTVLLLLYLGRLGQLHFRPRWSWRLKMLRRKMTVYGFGVLFHQVNATMYRLVDSLVMAAFLNLTAVGIYTTMIFVLELMVVPWRSMYKLVYPLVGEHWKNRALDKIAILYKQVSIVNLIFGGFVFALLVVNVHNILRLLPPRFEAGRDVILILGMARLFDLATGINQVIVITSRYYPFSLVFLSLLTVLTVATNYVLIPIFGINGAALATTFSVFVLNLAQVLFVRWKFDMQPFGWRTLVALGVIGSVIAVGLVIPRIGFMPLDALVRSGVCTVLFWWLVLRLNVSPDVQEYVARQLGRVGLGKVARILSGPRQR